MEPGTFYIEHVYLHVKTLGVKDYLLSLEREVLFETGSMERHILYGSPMECVSGSYMECLGSVLFPTGSQANHYTRNQGFVRSMGLVI